MTERQKVPGYMSGSLTGLKPEERGKLLKFYEGIAEVAERHGIALYLPHQHSDAVKNPDLLPPEIDKMDRTQVARASVMIAEISQPSHGVGIELEMARAYGVNILLLGSKDSVEKIRRGYDRKILGNPTIRAIVSYESQDDALAQLERVLVEKEQELKTKGSLCHCPRDEEFFNSLET